MKKSTASSFETNNGNPEIYQGLTTRKRNLDMVPLYTMILSIIIFFVIGINTDCHESFGYKINYIYRISDMGRISLSDGGIYLFLMLVTLICYKLRLYIGGLVAGSIASFMMLITLPMIIAKAPLLSLLLFFPLALCVFANELAIILGIYLTKQKKKGNESCIL